MDELKRFESFLSVVDQCSFSRAASQLGTNKARVSRHVAELEDFLQVRLLNRNTRAVELTDLGRNYARDCRSILAQIHAANAAVREQQTIVGGKLRIQAPPGLGNHHLSLMWGAFNMEHPNVQLEVDLSDLAATATTNKKWDLKIQAGSVDGSNFVARTLTKFEVVMCAAPGYLARSPVIEHPADIAQHTAIIDTSQPHELRWSLCDAFQKTSWINQFDMNAMRCNSTDTCLNQTINGYGVSYLPMYMVDKHLASGVLLRLLPTYTGRISTISVLYHSHKHLSRTMRTMIDFLQHSLADKKWGGGD